MTYDEWKKARVEGALFASTEERSAQMGERIDRGMFEQFRNEDPVGFAEEIMQMQCGIKAADAVPLPNDEELVEELAAVCHNNYWADEYANASEVEKAAARQQGLAVLAALRPWIASMIEKGKGV
jgi:hypothetical protein